jgi:hypothetical protein
VVLARLFDEPGHHRDVFGKPGKLRHQGVIARERDLGNAVLQPIAGERKLGKTTTCAPVSRARSIAWRCFSRFSCDVAQLGGDLCNGDADALRGSPYCASFGRFLLVIHLRILSWVSQARPTKAGSRRVLFSSWRHGDNAPMPNVNVCVKESERKVSLSRPRYPRPRSRPGSDPHDADDDLRLRPSHRRRHPRDSRRHAHGARGSRRRRGGRRGRRALRPGRPRRLLLSDELRRLLTLPAG